MPETQRSSLGRPGSWQIVVGIDGARGSRQALQHAVEVFEKPQPPRSPVLEVACLL